MREGESEGAKETKKQQREVFVSCLLLCCCCCVSLAPCSCSLILLSVCEWVSESLWIGFNHGLATRSG